MRTHEKLLIINQRMILLQTFWSDANETHEDASENYQVIHIPESVHLFFKEIHNSDDDKHRTNIWAYNLKARQRISPVIKKPKLEWIREPLIPTVNIIKFHIWKVWQLKWATQIYKNKRRVNFGVRQLPLFNHLRPGKWERLTAFERSRWKRIEY